jgi:hypothetical protein
VGFAVIAQQPGELTLAGVRVPWWNVTAQRWEVAELPPRPLTIKPSTEVAPAEAAAAPTATTTPVAPSTRSWWPVASAVLAAAGWLAALVIWWRTRGERAKASEQSRQAAVQKPQRLRRILRDLDSACAVGDADAARRSLLAYAETKFGAAAPRSLGALAAVLPEAVGREVLTLEAGIYGATAQDWQGEGLRAALPELEKLDQAGPQAKDEPLLPLYR